MNNLLLGGVKGVGKTTHGKALAERLGRRFIDTDELMEKQVGLANREIYVKRGPLFFRKLEEEVVAGLIGISGAIISLGGGAILSAENRRVFPKLGKLVCLFLEKEAARGMWRPSILGDFDQLYQERMEGYRMCSCIWVRVEDPNLLGILERLADGQ